MSRFLLRLLLDHVNKQAARSSVGSISLKVVEERHNSLDEVVTCPANGNFLDHVADVQAALSAFDAHATNVDNQLRSLEVFFVSRSFPKFVARFNEDTRLCSGKQLFEVIRQWKQPRRRREILLPKLVNWPDWLVQLKALPPIPSRLVNGEVKCKISDDIKRVWIVVMLAFLVGVDKAIGDVMLARDKGAKGEKEADRAMFQLNDWCHVEEDDHARP